MLRSADNTDRHPKMQDDIKGERSGQPKAADLEKYFHEPGRPNVLKPGVKGTAMCNIRTALSSLGLWREWQNADIYDEELLSVVRTFQSKHDHPNADGYVGPGTRRLLVYELLQIEFDFERLLPVFDYDVALSFASEERNAVEALASILRREGIRVFYDSYERADLWGKPLIEHLEAIYSKRAQYCVRFASKAYATKAWPTHERRIAQERAFRNLSDDYILPIRCDDTKIPGLPSTVGFISIELGAEKIGDLLIAKIRGNRSRIVSLWSDAHSNTFG
jgi:peptidoglycan hydrolase-like protein with peptidoglycan-binding domain